MKPSRLSVLLATLFLIAGLLVFDKSDESAHIAETRQIGNAAIETERPTGDDPAGDSSALLVLRERRKVAASIAGFEMRDWTPPPPPQPLPFAPPSSPPPLPQAPSLPFTYIGKQRQEGLWTVFLTSQEKTYIAREGAMIDLDYRVEKIAPPNLTISYLPLRQSQMLVIGPAE